MNRALLIALLGLSGCLTECGAIGGGSIGQSRPVAGGTSVCDGLRAGGICPTSGFCRIALVGDSIMRRPDPTTDDVATNLLDRLVNQCAVVDSYAADGNTCAMVLSTQYPDNVQGEGYHVVINNCGVNDLAGTRDSADVISDREALAALVAADGSRLLDQSINPWGGTAPELAETDIVNAELATPVNASTVYVDTHTLMDNGSGGLDAAYDSGDGTHQNSAGTDLIADTHAATLKGQ